jgi:hypothetical protein
MRRRGLRRQFDADREVRKQRRIELEERVKLLEAKVRVLRESVLMECRREGAQ